MKGKLLSLMLLLFYLSCSAGPPAIKIEFRADHSDKFLDLNVKSPTGEKLAVKFEPKKIIFNIVLEKNQKLLKSIDLTDLYKNNKIGEFYFLMKDLGIDKKDAFLFSMDYEGEAEIQSDFLNLKAGQKKAISGNKITYPLKGPAIHNFVIDLRPTFSTKDKKIELEFQIVDHQMSGQW